MANTHHNIAGRFEIDEKNLVGRGGMGDVYRGIDTQTGQATAKRNEVRLVPDTYQGP